MFSPKASKKSNFVNVGADQNNKSLATSLNIFVIKRILDIAQQEGRVNRTNLAGKTGLNYITCTRYIGTLVLFGWIRMLPSYNQQVVITETGIEIKKALEILE